MKSLDLIEIKHEEWKIKVNGKITRIFKSLRSYLVKSLKKCVFVIKNFLFPLLMTKRVINSTHFKASVLRL